MALYDTLKNGETQEYTVSWKSHGYYVWDEKGVVRNCLPKMREWTPTMNETLRSLYACLYWVHPAIKMSNLLLLHDHTMLHSSVCNRGHQKFCMGSVTTSILHSWPWTIRLSPVQSFEKKPVRAPLCQWQSTAERLQRESNFYCLLKCQRWRLHWKMTLPSAML